MSNTILKIDNLSKKYGKVQALDKLSLSIESGMVFGILGPNGSGKTTTLGILLGVLTATSGKFSWFDNGQDDANRMRIGALLETPNFFPYLTSVQNLRIVAKIKKLDDVDNRINRVLKSVDLLARKDSKFKTYSLGMKQRLAIASALLNDPDVLVLDEPTNGLDPQGIAEIRQLILDIAKRNKTILIASHQLDEIEKTCTDVAILKNGILIRQSNIDDVLGDNKRIEIGCSDMSKLKTTLQTMDGIEIREESDSVITIKVTNGLTTEQLNKHCFEHGIVLSELRESKRSLEQQFLEITK